MPIEYIQQLNYTFIPLNTIFFIQYYFIKAISDLESSLPHIFTINILSLWMYEELEYE